MMEHFFLETIKVKDGIFYNTGLHQERLERTAYTFFGTKPRLILSSEMIPEHLKEGLVKCRVVYGAEIVTIEFESYCIRKIDSLAIINHEAIDYQYKSLDRTLLNELYLKRGQASNIIIVKNRLVTDSSYANLVFENHNGLFTPKRPLLEGIKRRILLNKGIIQEKDILVSDLDDYTNVFFINAMIDLEDRVCTSSILIR